MNGWDGAIKQSARWHMTLSKIDESIVLVMSLILDSIMFNSTFLQYESSDPFAMNWMWAALSVKLTEVYVQRLPLLVNAHSRLIITYPKIYCTVFVHNLGKNIQAFASHMQFYEVDDSSRTCWVRKVLQNSEKSRSFLKFKTQINGTFRNDFPLHQAGYNRRAVPNFSCLQPLMRSISLHTHSRLR